MRKGESCEDWKESLHPVIGHATTSLMLGKMMEEGAYHFAGLYCSRLLKYKIATLSISKYFAREMTELYVHKVYLQ